MKIAYKAVFLILCLNIATLIVEGYEIGPSSYAYVTPLNTTQALNATDLDTLISVGDTTNPIFYDLQVALWGLWKLCRTVVVGFPDAMTALEVPTLIGNGLYVLFITAWATLIIEIRSGRDITDA